MTPRERVSDERLAQISAWARAARPHAWGEPMLGTVELAGIVDGYADARARLARIEAWAADDALPALDSYPTPEHGSKTADAISATSSAGVLRPTPGRDAPATSEAAASGLCDDDTTAGSSPVRGAGSSGNAGSPADAAADRLRRGWGPYSDNVIPNDAAVAKREADIRAVLDDRERLARLLKLATECSAQWWVQRNAFERSGDAARDEAARRGAALESLIVAAKEATQRFFNESSMLVPADEVVEITGPLDDAANRARAALAPASAAPQERPE